MIRIRCRCGEVLHADEQHVGRKVRCRCGRTHTVRMRRQSSSRQPHARPGFMARLRARFRRQPLRMSSARRRAGVSHKTSARRRRGIEARFPAAARWTRRAAFAYLGLALAALFVVWVLGDRTAIGTIMLFSGRWLLLLPLIPLAPAAALLHRRSLPILAAAGAIILLPVMGLRLGIASLLPDGDGDRLRVATFNATGSFDSMREMLALMGAWDIDVALIQECPIRSDLTEVGFWNVRGTGDLCIIGRHPVRQLDRLDLDTIVPRRQSYGGTSMAARYELALPDRPVALVNVHLETARRGLRGIFDADFDRVGTNLLLRGVESRTTARWIGDDVDDVIVAGDFNMPVESAIYRQSWGHLRNAFSRVGRGFGFTRDNGWIRVRIDHVLTGSAWKPTRAWVGPAIGSDHRPVFAELRRSD